MTAPGSWTWNATAAPVPVSSGLPICSGRARRPASVGGRSAPRRRLRAAALVSRPAQRRRGDLPPRLAADRPDGRRGADGAPRAVQPDRRLRRRGELDRLLAARELFEYRAFILPERRLRPPPADDAPLPRHLADARRLRQRLADREPRVPRRHPAAAPGRRRAAHQRLRGYGAHAVDDRRLERRQERRDDARDALGAGHRDDQRPRRPRAHLGSRRAHPARHPVAAAGRGGPPAGRPAAAGVRRRPAPAS